MTAVLVLRGQCRLPDVRLSPDSTLACAGDADEAPPNELADPAGDRFGRPLSAAVALRAAGPVYGEGSVARLAVGLGRGNWIDLPLDWGSPSSWPPRRSGCTLRPPVGAERGSLLMAA